MAAPIIGLAIRTTAAQAIASAAAGELSVDIDDIIEYFEKTEDKIDEGSKEALDKLTTVLEAAVKSEIQGAGARATSKLLNSVTTVHQKNVQGSTTLLVGSSVPYAQWVEYGRTPGDPPPIEEILKWMQAKGLPHTVGSAYLIARKIGRTGIEGKYVFARALQKVQFLIKPTVEDGIASKL